MSFLKRFGFDDIGSYEIRVFALAGLVAAFSPFAPLQFIVTQYSPPHYCDVTDTATHTNLSEDAREAILNRSIPWLESTSGKMVRSSCLRYNSSRLPTSMVVEGEFYLNKSEQELVPCTSFRFEVKETSAVTEFGMVCDKSWQQPLFISVQMCGVAIGGMLAGASSDKFGRRPTFLCCLLFRYCFTMLTSFSTNLAMYGIMVFLSGTTTLVDYITIFVLANEVIPSPLRPFTVFFMEFFYDIGATFLGLLVYLLPNWRWFLRTIGISGVLFIPYYWVLDESPSWLVATGKYEKAKILLEKISKINKRPLKSIEEVKESLTEQQKGSTSFKEALKSLLKEPVLFRRLIIMAFAWFIACLTFYAVVYSSNNLSGNRYVNIVCQALTGCVTPILYFAMVHSLGNRKVYMLSAASVVVALVVIPFLQSWRPMMATVVAFVAKTLVGVSFVVVFGITPELFPTGSRQVAFGVCNFSARVGGIVAPFVITVGTSGSDYATVFGTAGAALVSVFFFGFLPETKRMELPQNTQEALDLKSGWNLPCGRRGPGKEVEVYMKNGEGSTV